MAGRVQPKGYMSSGLRTASAAIKTSKGRVGGIYLVTSATNSDVTVILYDHSSTASGTEIGRAMLGSAESVAFKYQPLPDVVFVNGCWAEMTNGNYVIHFS